MASGAAAISYMELVHGSGRRGDFGIRLVFFFKSRTAELIQFKILLEAGGGSATL